MDPKLGRYIEPIQLFNNPQVLDTAGATCGPHREAHTLIWCAPRAPDLPDYKLSTSVQPRTAADKMKEGEESKSDKDRVFTHKKKEKSSSGKHVEGFLKACSHHPPLLYSTFLLPS